jgi:hypothetical protein
VKSCEILIDDKEYQYQVSRLVTKSQAFIIDERESILHTYYEIREEEENFLDNFQENNQSSQ